MMTTNRVRVLAVEDEPMLLLNMQDFLEDAGYDVITASNADAAVSILEHDLDIQILVTDIDMPGSMNGIRLAQAVRNRWPPIRIIVVSGAVGSMPPQLPEGSTFFKKPYEMAKIIDAMRAA